MAVVRMAVVRKVTKIQNRRIERREELWPGLATQLWDRTVETGFATIPRTLPLIGTLIKHLSEAKDPRAVYFDLWTRQFDDGFVEVRDEEDMARAAGYGRTRTWREAIDALEQLGFVKVQPKGSRRHGYIFLPHPHDVVEALHEQGRVPDWWWSLFLDRVTEIGAVLRLRDQKRRQAEAPPVAAAT
jgi:hypothetical protein